MLFFLHNIQLSNESAEQCDENETTRGREFGTIRISTIYFYVCQFLEYLITDNPVTVCCRCLLRSLLWLQRQLFSLAGELESVSEAVLWLCNFSSGLWNNMLSEAEHNKNTQFFGLSTLIKLEYSSSFFLFQLSTFFFAVWVENIPLELSVEFQFAFDFKPHRRVEVWHTAQTHSERG